MEALQTAVREQVNQTLHQGFEIPLDALKPEATLFEDLKLDSLDAIDLVVHLEERFKVKLDGEIFKNIRTLSDVYRLVEGLQSQSNPLPN